MKINNNIPITDTIPKKIEVVVGALTENDVKDHGTTTGVVKTVNKQRNKIKPHLTGQLRKETDQLRDTVRATKAMGIIKDMMIQKPTQAIAAQANQTAEGVLQLLR